MGIFDSLYQGVTSSALKSVASKLPSSVTSLTSSITSLSSASSPNLLSPLYTVTIQQDAIPQEGRPILTVKAHLPEQLSEETHSEYDTPFADGLIDNRKLQTLAQIAGWSPITQAMTAQFWRGSSPIELQLELVLVAYNSSDEITQTLLALKSMQMPTMDKATHFLRAPGPRLEWNSAAADALWDATKNTATSVGALTLSALGDAAGTPDGTKPDASIMSRLSQIGKTSGQQMVDAARQLIIPTGKISIRLGTFRYYPDMLIRSVSDQYNIVLGPDGRPQRSTVSVSAMTRETPTFDDLPGIYCIDNAQTGLIGKK